MADAVSGLSGPLGGTLGGVLGTLQGAVGGLINKGQGWIDKFFPPEKRGELMGQFNAFVQEKPKLASFILSQIAVSGIPLGIFICMTVTVALFSIIAALLIALLGSVLFIVFCVGVALCILLPTLFFTTAVATFIWLWGLGVYYLYKWFNQEEIANIKDATGQLLSMPEASEADKLPALTAGDDKVSSHNQKSEGEGEVNGDGEKKKPPKLENGHAKKHDNHPDDKVTVADAVGKSTGFDSENATNRLKDKAGDVGNQVSGAKDKVDGVTGGALGGVTGKVGL